MSFRTLTAQYPGRCRRCREQFEAGTRIRYGGRGMTYHFAAECPASESYMGEDAAYENVTRTGLEPFTVDEAVAKVREMAAAGAVRVPVDRSAVAVGDVVADCYGNGAVVTSVDAGRVCMMATCGSDRGRLFVSSDATLYRSQLPEQVAA